MNTVKTNTDQFLGQVELQRIISALGNYSIDSNNSFVNTYGIVKNRVDSTFLNLAVTGGGAPNEIIINTGFAIDNQRRIIEIKQSVNRTINDDNTDYFVYIQSVQTNEEEGLVSISETGQMTGVDTEFTQVLRGGINFNSKIKFTNAVANTGEYEVFSVTSDTVAQLTGAGFVIENDLKYKVRGTFSLGKVIDPAKKDIFQYDKFEIIISALSNLEVIGSVFLLAKVKVNGSLRTITDMRTQLLETNADAKIGDLQYTEQNYITNNETITESLDELDKAIEENIIDFSTQLDGENAATQQDNPGPLNNTTIVTPRVLGYFKNQLLVVAQIISAAWSFVGSLKYILFDGSANTTALPTYGGGLVTGLIPAIFVKSAADIAQKRGNIASQVGFNNSCHSIFVNVAGAVTGFIKQLDDTGLLFDGLKQLIFRDNSLNNAASIYLDSSEKLIIKGLKYEEPVIEFNTTLDFEDIQPSTFYIRRVNAKMAFIKVETVQKVKAGVGSHARLYLSVNKIIDVLTDTFIAGSFVNQVDSPTVYLNDNFRSVMFEIKTDRISVNTLNGDDFIPENYYRFKFSGVIPLNSDFVDIVS
jgi:hypothetical protein